MSSEESRQTRDAFISGLIQGWASRLSNPNEVKNVIKDMLEFSKKLAKGAGVTLFEKDESERG